MPDGDVAGSNNMAIALAATFSADPAARWLRHWFTTVGVAADIRLAPYGQLLAELSAPSSFSTI